MAYGHRAWRNVSLVEITFGVFGLRNQLFLYILINPQFWRDAIITHFVLGMCLWGMVDEMVMGESIQFLIPNKWIMFGCSFNILLLKPNTPLVYVIYDGTSPHFVTEMTYSSQVLHRLRDAQLVEIFDAQVDDKVMFFFVAVLHFHLLLNATFYFFGVHSPCSWCSLSGLKCLNL